MIGKTKSSIYYNFESVLLRYLVTRNLEGENKECLINNNWKNMQI